MSLPECHGALVLASACLSMAATGAASLEIRPLLSRRDEVVPALAACWSPPRGLSRLERVEITVRLSLKRNGELLGTPRITFSNLNPDGPAREILTKAVLEALRRCTPLHLTDGLGGAIAGRPVAIRFVYDGPKGQGV
jgi:hypothetical protein